MLFLCNLSQQPVPLPYLLPLVRCLNNMVYCSIQQDPLLLLEVSIPPSGDGRGGGTGNSDESTAASTQRSHRIDVLR